MVYKLGDWKKSTLITLERLKAENDEGRKPKAVFFRNGAIAHWLKLLKDGEYIDNGNGYQINKKGLELLETLRHNPPKNTRRKKKTIKSVTPIENVVVPLGFTVEIKSNTSDFKISFSADVEEEKMLKAVMNFKKELGK